jgi:hypothetical protein
MKNNLRHLWAKNEILSIVKLMFFMFLNLSSSDDMDQYT